VDFFFQAEDGIRDRNVTGVQTCALPICDPGSPKPSDPAIPRRHLPTPAGTFNIFVGFCFLAASYRQTVIMTDDAQLLQQYREERSEAAFKVLVIGYIDLVYSAAFRVLNGDSHLAQDVTQTVFIDLARKAWKLTHAVV